MRYVGEYESVGVRTIVFDGVSAGVAVCVGVAVNAAVFDGVDGGVIDGEFVGVCGGVTDDEFDAVKRIDFVRDIDDDDGPEIDNDIVAFDGEASALELCVTASEPESVSHLSP